MSRLAQVTYSLALLLMLGWLLVAGQSILLPVLVGVIAVYILTSAAEAMVPVPIIGRLPRRWRRFLALVFVTLGFLILASFITSSATSLSAALPRYAENFDALQLKFLNGLGIKHQPNWGELSQKLVNMVDATTLMPIALSTISNGGSVLLAATLYAVFLLAELDSLPDKTRRAMKDHAQAEHTLELARQINDKIGSYLAAKTLVNVILALVSYAILLMLGIAHPAFWAIIIGLLNYIPYIGSIIAVVFPVTMSLIQFTSFAHAGLALVLLMIPQLAVGYYIEPKFLGRSVNLSPFTVLLALAVWSALWGMTGAILAVPLTAMVMIILAQIPTTRWIAVMMSETGDL